MKKIFFSLLCIVYSFYMPISAYASEITADSRQELEKIIKEAWCSREKNIHVKYTDEDFDSIYEDFDSILLNITDIDNTTTSDDADYIYGLLSEYEITQLDGMLDMRFDYYETLEETAQVNKEVNSILLSLNLSGLSEYEKVKAIHDYIVKRFTYDNSLENESVYEALFSGKSSSNGYTLLAYKMLTELGIECKYISGIGFQDIDFQEEHVWNIVKLNGNWYNMDITWDDPDDEDTIYYDYFLKGSETFYKDHKPDLEFSSKYSISSFDFKQNEINLPEDIIDFDNEADSDNLSDLEEEEDKKEVDLDNIKVVNQLTIKRGKTKTIYCDYPENTNKDKITLIYYKSTNKKVAAVDTNGVITGKKKGKCYIYTYIILDDGTNKEYKTKIKVKK